MSDTPRRQSHPTTASDTATYVWVRRCVRCRSDDISSAFGDAALIDTTWPWRCRTCGGPEWTPVRLAYPTVLGGTACAHAPEDDP